MTIDIGLSTLSLNRMLRPVIQAIRLNALEESLHRGQPVVIKRRNRFGRFIPPVANLFFRAARVPISFWLDTRAWQYWELTFFRMLNPDFHAAPVGFNAICEDKLPGLSMWKHLQQGTLTPRMLAAAGREFRRAHSFWSDIHQGPWSHGDGAMCNVMYDPAEDRARLIDFELVHDPNLTPAQRHADDLLSFLLDLVSLVPENRWLPCAMCFLTTYQDPAALAALEQRLVPPRGVARFWFKVRTNFADTHTLIRRLEALRRELHPLLAPCSPVHHARRADAHADSHASAATGAVPLPTATP